MDRTVLYLNRLLLVLAGVALLVMSAFVADRLLHRNKVSRNVTLAGYNVSHGDESLLDQIINTGRHATVHLPVTIRTEGLVIETTVAEAGISVATDAVKASAFTAHSGGGTFGSLIGWWRSLRKPAMLDIQFQLDPTVISELINRHPRQVVLPAVEPSFSGDGPGLQVVAPADGGLLEASSVVQALGAAVEAGRPPYDVTVKTTPIAPIHTSADLEEALAIANSLPTKLSVVVNGQSAAIGAESVRRWIASDVVAGKLTAIFDPERVQSSVETLMAAYATPLPQPEFSVAEGELVVDLGEPALRCCGPGVASLLAAAVAEGGKRAVELPTVPTEEDLGASRAAEYGINELVHSFTTKHACCAGRVTNIHRFADLIQGYIIEPGKTLSLNDYVGRRTRANGFVPAGAIQAGRFTDEVGGGISQFATTIFNASFFAGLDIPEYQSHSIYISRYPYGREATVSFPSPDLKITNNTPYAAMIWPHYTGTSITVDIYSTKYYQVEQTDQTSWKFGACTRVRTYRQRTAPDGTVIDDSFLATYRPGEGRDCSGNSTP